MSIEINGNQNTVQVEKADRIVVTGNGNKIVVKESQKKSEKSKYDYVSCVNSIMSKRLQTGIRGWICI